MGNRFYDLPNELIEYIQQLAERLAAATKIQSVFRRYRLAFPRIVQSIEYSPFGVRRTFNRYR